MARDRTLLHCTWSSSRINISSSPKGYTDGIARIWSRIRRCLVFQYTRRWLPRVAAKVAAAALATAATGGSSSLLAAKIAPRLLLSAFALGLGCRRSSTIAGAAAATTETAAAAAGFVQLAALPPSGRQPDRILHRNYHHAVSAAVGNVHAASIVAQPFYGACCCSCGGLAGKATRVLTYLSSESSSSGGGFEKRKLRAI